jgi:hypothetical protein
MSHSWLALSLSRNKIFFVFLDCMIYYINVVLPNSNFAIYLKIFIICNMGDWGQRQGLMHARLLLYTELHLQPVIFFFFEEGDKVKKLQWAKHGCTHL